MKNKRWFVFALALCLALALGSCGLEPFGGDIKGSGVMGQKNVPLSNTASGYSLYIDGVSVRGAAEMRLVVDESLRSAAVLETDNNILYRFNLDCNPVSGEIRLSVPRYAVFSPTRLTLTVGAPVREIDIEGMWKVSYNCPGVKEFRLDVDGTVNGDFTFGALNRLDMDFDGLSDISMRSAGAKNCMLVVDGTLHGNFDLGEMDSLDAQLHGLSTIAFSGTTRRALFELNGGGNIYAFGLTAQEADVIISGLGNCEITAEQRLNAVIDGGGRITYAGNPAAVSQQVNGLGSIRAK